MNDVSCDTGPALDKLIAARRSVRRYTAAGVPLRALQRLLYNAQGDTGGRAAPSAHGLYPLQLFVIARRIADAAVDPGLYAIDRAHGRLAERLGPVAPGALLASSLAEDQWLETSAAVVVVAADRDVARAHFADQPPDGLRGHRYIDVEAGAALQNMALTAAADGLGGVVVMGFDETILTETLALPGGLAPVALFCVGAPEQENTG